VWSDAKVKQDATLILEHIFQHLKLEYLNLILQVLSPSVTHSFTPCTKLTCSANTSHYRLHKTHLFSQYFTLQTAQNTPVQPILHTTDCTKLTCSANTSHYRLPSWTHKPFLDYAFSSYLLLLHLVACRWLAATQELLGVR